MAQNTAQPDPSASASPPSSPAWLRVAGWAVVTLVCLAVFGSGSFLLPAMACILVLLLALRKPIEKAEGTEADKRKEETGV